MIVGGQPGLLTETMNPWSLSGTKERIYHKLSPGTARVGRVKG